MDRRDFLSQCVRIMSTFLIMKIDHVWSKDGVTCVDKQHCIINIADNGCKAYKEGDSAPFDNREILQNIIDSCRDLKNNGFGKVTLEIPDGIYYISAISGNTNSGMPGAYCLQLYSNINIIGTGVLKLLPSQYGKGAFFRMLASDRQNPVENIYIHGIGIDGNSLEQVAAIQASNIVLECSGNIKVHNVKSFNANGNGILIRGATDINKPVKNVEILNCIVTNCSKIGIQISQFNGLIISKNKVSQCLDNGIDLYGDLGKGQSSITNGNNFEITGNFVSNCLNGIFPETVANGVINNNTLINLVSSGIHINRIHGLPQNIILKNNAISNAPVGVTITGDMKRISVSNNEFINNHKCFISFGSHSGNVSGIVVNDNKMHVVKDMSGIVSFSGIRANDIRVNNNQVIDEKGLGVSLYQKEESVKLNKNTVVIE